MLLTKAVAIQKARKLLNKTKRALRKSPGVARSTLEQIEAMEELQSLLPPSIVDAADGGAALKQAVSDLDALLPELGKLDWSNRSVSIDVKSKLA